MSTVATTESILPSTTTRCYRCKEHLPPDRFTPGGLRVRVCRACKSTYDRKMRVSRIRAAHKRELDNNMLMIECRMCGLTKIESEFTTRGAVASGRDRNCRECKRTVDAKFRSRHREDLAERQRDRPAKSKRIQTREYVKHQSTSSGNGRTFRPWRLPSRAASA